MGVNKNDEWTHSRTCLCYHDNQCQQPTRFYARYLRDRHLGWIPNAGYPDIRGSSPDLRESAATCSMTSSVDVGRQSLRRQKWTSLVSLDPGVATSPDAGIWISSSTRSLPAVDPDRDTARERRRDSQDPSSLSTGRASRWRPSYTSVCGRKWTDDVIEASYSRRRNESAGLRLALLKNLAKAGKWLRKFARTRRRYPPEPSPTVGVDSPNPSGEDADSGSRTPSSDGSAIDDAIRDRSTYSLPSLQDRLSDDASNYCPEPISRSVDGLLGITDPENAISYPGQQRGPASGLSAALRRLLRQDDREMASSSPEGSISASSSLILRNRRMSTPHPIRSRPAKSVFLPQPSKTHLKRAHSAPDLINDNNGALKAPKKQDVYRVSLSTAGDLAIPSHSYSSDDDSDDSLSYGIISVAESSLSLQHEATLEEIFEVNEITTYAEALWDHVTMDPEELGFRAGDVIKVTDTRDKNWWYGHMTDKQGWFPASFVRLRANQVEIIAEDASVLVSSRQHSRESVSQSQARTNVVNEIVHAEREYVRHLRDVIQGYVEKCRGRPAMFPPEMMAAIFSNITDIYHFSVKFLKDLDSSVDVDQPHQSKLGKVFIKHQNGFKIYSEYCNNHPVAQEELRKLQKNPKYTHFFEACRLLQDMINLPLEGFLLAPVQKICKYPLQLRELLKYTPRCHVDHDDITKALDTMHGIAVMINERKRKMESIEKLAEWQLTVEDWQGPDLLDRSSELIYSGEMMKVKSPYIHQERVFFLFDHQLIYCKKDLLWRDVLVYKGRINLDNCEIKALADEKDLTFCISVKNALKIYNTAKDKWHLLYCRTAEERTRWFAAFQEERRRVEEDKRNGFNLEEFRSKAHLPQKPAKKRKKKRRHHQSKAAEKPAIVTSEKAVTPDTPDVTDSSRRWMMFTSRKMKM